MLRKIISFLLLGFLGLSLVAVAENQMTSSKASTPGTPVITGSTTTAAPTTTKTPAPTTNSSAVIPVISPKQPVVTVVPAAPAPVTSATDAVINTAEIEKITGLKGHLDVASNTFKLVMPRNDLNIIINGVKLSPAMGLTSWAVFKKTANTMTVKADLVVTENQVNTILSLALDNGLAVIALHNHMLWESPKVMFIHVEGAGDEITLAQAIHKVFAKTVDTNDEASDFPLASIDTADTTFDAGKIDTILGGHGAYRNGIYHILVSRYIQSNDQAKTKAPIINTAATFAGSNDEAVIDGDLALRASDLHAVLDELHKAGIAVVALHQHESINSPTRVVYLHYFGVGKCSTLAKGIRKALDMAKTKEVAVTKPSIALLTSAPKLIKSSVTPVMQATSHVDKKKQG